MTRLDGTKVDVSGKPFDALVYLVRNPARSSIAGSS